MAKIILTRDVEKLGAAGEVVEVKDGYARNFLVPRGYAERWTRGAQRHIDQLIENRRKHEIATAEDALTLRNRIQEIGVVVVSRKAGSNGRLFGAVTTKHVAEALGAALGRVIDHRSITLAEMVKATGEYAATVKLHAEVAAKLTLKVVAE